MEDSGNTRQSVSREFPLESYKMIYEVVMLTLIIRKKYNCLDYIGICLDLQNGWWYVSFFSDAIEVKVGK